MVKAVIHTVFEAVAAERPESPAVRTAAGDISFRSLNEAANRLAFQIRDGMRIQPGDIVGLYMASGAAYVTGMLAVAKAGAVFLPLDPGMPALRQQKLLAKAAPALILTDAESAGAWAPVDSPIAAMQVDSVITGAAANLPLTVSAEDASYIVFTSGSTGEPKAILGSQKGLSHFVHWELNEFGLDKHVRVSQLAPPTFDVSLRDMFVPLLAGGTVCIPPAEMKGRIDRLLDWLDAEAITLMHCVPSLFRTLIQELGRRPKPDTLLARLRYVLLAGEPLYAADVRKWRALMGDRTELVNLYGPSETTLAKAFHRIGDVPPDASGMIPIGNPLPNASLLILRDGELCDPGEIGEVYIKTAFMSKGYYGDPELTADRFVQNPLTPDVADRVYRTGDFGRYRPDRRVELLGRQDSQVKVKGIRIELAEVEQALLEYPPVEQAAVVAHHTADHEVVLTAYYTANRGLTDAEVRGHLGRWLPESMHPAYFLQMDRFPVNLHGKVVRRALPRPADLLYQQQPYVAPSNEIEQELALLWDEVLHIRKVSVTHAFVELGGDSLNAIRVLPRIAKRFHVEITFPQLFPRGTVRQLAALITERQRVQETVPVADDGIAPPTAEELRWLAE